MADGKTRYGAASTENDNTESLWVLGAMVNLRGNLPNSTAGCGKPHVRWCGRANRRNPVSSTRS